MLYEKVIKPVIFQLNPETAHHLAIGGLEAAAKIPGAIPLLRACYGSLEREQLRQSLWGIPFGHPVGLAAGLDKNGEAAAGFSAMGFSFIEVGTVTPKPQPGNKRPRLFRLPSDQGLINRMGFNNKGAERLGTLLDHMKSAHRRIPIAVNIGKNKTTPNEHAENDYRECLTKLYKQGDFFVVNISSPNTPNLRELQHGDELSRLLASVMDECKKQAELAGGRPKPVLVKIAPDLTDQELVHTVKTIKESGISGIIATNTTISRSGLSHKYASETGGLSGRPLRIRSTEVVRSIYRLTEGNIPIIGCGGIFSAADAYEKIRAGASMVEVYTALIYHGPGLIDKMNRGLCELLNRDGFSHISQAIGADC